MQVLKNSRIIADVVYKKNLIKIIETVLKIFKIYGMKGVKRAIHNKLNNRELLYKIQELNLSADEFGKEVIKRQQAEINEENANETIQKFCKTPLISVIMPIYNPIIAYLKDAIDSLQKQYYINWELCAVDDGSQDKCGIILLEKYMETDKRIHLVKSLTNNGISNASNMAINIAKGEYSVLLDQDDVLTPDAFYWVVKTINENNKADFLFSDECKFRNTGKDDYFDFLIKPNWDPCLLINNMFVGHLVIYKTKLLQENGGFNAKFDFGQDYELAVRLGDIAHCIVHIPRILYFWRAIPSSTACGGKPFSNKINMAVPYEWLKRKNILCNIRKNIHYNYPVVIGAEKKVSIVFTPVLYEQFMKTLMDIFDITSYKNYEIIVIAEKKLLLTIKKHFPYIGNLKLIIANDNDDFVKRFNIAASVADGEIFVFMTECCAPGNKEWLAVLIDSLSLPSIGAASPAVLNDDQTVKYAGSSAYFSNDFNFIGTPYRKQRFYDNYYKYLLSPLVSKECLALSRDCIAVQKNIFYKIGEFDAINTGVYCFNEDFSFRLQEMGYKCFYNSNSQIINQNKNAFISNNTCKKEYLYCLWHWGRYYQSDPYFTVAMKNQLLNSDAGNMQRFFVNVVNNKINLQNGKNVLVFSHELTRTGAPIVILDAVREMVASGYNVVVVSPFDGDLREEYIKLNVPVIVDYHIAWGRCADEGKAMFAIDWYMDNLIKEFDLLLVGTLMGHNIITRYQNHNIPIMWWLHEGKYTLDIVAKYLPKKLANDVIVYYVGTYVQEMLEKYNLHYKGKTLLYGVTDSGLEYREKNILNNKVRFLIAGTIDERKGQDLVFLALKELKKNILEKTEFIFVGAQSFGNVFKKITKLKQKYTNVKIFGPMSRDKLFQLYNEVDCLLCTSRDDPMPVVVTEAMMFSKTCLCSTGTGTSRYIKEGKNGFLFDNNNASMLAEKITYLVENKDKLLSVGKNGRLFYEEKFEMNIFRKNLHEILGEILNQ